MKRSAWKLHQKWIVVVTGAQPAQDEDACVKFWWKILRSNLECHHRCLWITSELLNFTSTPKQICWELKTVNITLTWGGRYLTWWLKYGRLFVLEWRFGTPVCLCLLAVCLFIYSVLSCLCLLGHQPEAMQTFTVALQRHAKFQTDINKVLGIIEKLLNGRFYRLMERVLVYSWGIRYLWLLCSNFTRVSRASSKIWNVNAMSFTIDIWISMWNKPKA